MARTLNCATGVCELSSSAAPGTNCTMTEFRKSARIKPQILGLVGDVPRLAALRSNAFKLAQPAAAESLANALLQLVPGDAQC